MPKQAIRFALGLPDRPRSAVWRLWVTKSDVYLAVRSLGGVTKLSLHQSGIWVSAFTAQSGATFTANNRRHATWRRPPEWHPGWTKGPVVIFPWVEWWDEMETTPQEDPRIVWLPPPAPGRRVQVLVLFSSRPGARPDEVSELGDGCLGPLVLANGQSVWLQYRTSPMAPDDCSGVAAIEKEYRVRIAGRVVDAFGLVTMGSTMPPMLVEIPMGRRQMTVVDKL